MTPRYMYEAKGCAPECRSRILHARVRRGCCSDWLMQVSQGLFGEFIRVLDTFGYLIGLFLMILMILNLENQPSECIFGAFQRNLSIYRSYHEDSVYQTTLNVHTYSSVGLCSHFYESNKTKARLDGAGAPQRVSLSECLFVLSPNSVWSVCKGRLCSF